jgi:hypothetical protein
MSRRTLSQILAVLGVGVIWLGVAGCTSDRQATSSDARTPGAVAALNCKAQPPQPKTLTTAQLAAFRPVRAVECVEANHVIPGHGLWLVREHRAATAGLEALQAAFERPPAPVPSGDACTTNEDSIPPIALIDRAGASIEPAGQRDGCGHLTRQLISAVRRLPWRTIAVEPIHQQTTPQALAAHCQQQWENENVDNGSARRSAGGPAFPASGPRIAGAVGRHLSVCIYSSTDRVDASTNETFGTFLRSVSLNNHQAGRLIAALAGPGPTGACRPQREFAVIEREGQAVNVELGGCWRVARDEDNPETTGSANAAVIARLLPAN